MINLYDEGCLAIAERLRLGVLEESARHSVRRRKAPGARPTRARRTRIAKDLGSRVAFGVVVFVGREREAFDILELQTLDPARLDRFKKKSKTTTIRCPLGNVLKIRTSVLQMVISQFAKQMSGF